MPQGQYKKCPHHMSIRTNVDRARRFLEAIRLKKIVSLSDKFDGLPLGTQPAVTEWALVECGATKCEGRFLSSWRWTWPKTQVTAEQALAFQRTISRMVVYFDTSTYKKKYIIDGKHAEGFLTPSQTVLYDRARAAKKKAGPKVQTKLEGMTMKGAFMDEPGPVVALPGAGVADRVKSLESLVAALDGRMADILAGLRGLQPAEQLAALVNQTNRMMTKHDDRSEKRLAAIEKYLEEILERMTAPTGKTEAA